MLRIAHVLHVDGAGGGPKVVRQLLEGLPASEFHQSFIHGGDGQVAQWCRDNGVEEREVPTSTLVRGLLGIRSLVDALREAGPDVAILHGQWAGPLGAWAARRAGVPHSIYVAHCPAFYHSTTLTRAIRNYFAEKIPCSLCDRVVTLSEGNFYNYLYRGWAPEAHLVQIHNGVDATEVPTDEVIARQQQRFAARGGERNAVFVGRLDDQKRVDWLLKAWERALRSRFGGRSHTWQLWIVGEGREREALERLSMELDLEDSVEFVGGQDDGLPWIAASDLLVLSSLYEGHALVPLEAMACSRPVAAFYTDGVTDSVVDGETGSLVPLGDPGALGDAIARLLSSPDEASAMGRAGRARVIADFSIDATLAAYATLFREVVMSGPRMPSRS